MTAEDCARIQSLLSKPLPAVKELRLAPRVTEDGWCRVIDGPFGAGLEWRVVVSGDQFEAAFRQERLELEGLGPFQLSGGLARTEADRLQVGPIRLQARTGDAAVLSATSPKFADVQSGAEAAGLERASLTVTGDRGLVDDVLGWAFRLDVAAARSSFIAARDQRADMLDWLDENALAVIDRDSAAAFRKMIDAYPRARGTAEITIREDRPVQIGPVISALLFGTSLTRGEAAQLIEEAGLRFTWTPG